jgi:hypothetical protein
LILKLLVIIVGNVKPNANRLNALASRIRNSLNGFEMRQNREYLICKDIAMYIKLQYPTVIFHFDLAGLNLSKAQAGMNKAIQFHRGFPDLFIAEPRMGYSGMFIEVKAEGTKLYKKNFEAYTPHIAEQSEFMDILRIKGYKCEFGVGWDECHKLIDQYLKPLIS